MYGTVELFKWKTEKTMVHSSKCGSCKTVLKWQLSNGWWWCGGGAASDLVLVNQPKNSGDLELHCEGGLVKSLKMHPDGRAYCW